jgi:hypothetical protein
MKVWKWGNSDKEYLIFKGPPYECRMLQDEEIQRWLAAGNTPEPPDPLPEPVDPGPSLADRVEAAETLINLILSEGEV